MSSRDERIRELFDGALDRDPAQRRSWLQEQCEGDPALFDSVWGLVEEHSDESAFLDPPLILTRPEDLVGQRLGDFTLTGLLGAGGMGAVYAADQAHLDQRVAVKIVHPHMVGGAEVVERFQREVRLMASLRHPGIVRVLVAGQERGLHWYAMELVEGSSLADLLARHKAGEPLPTGAPKLDDMRSIIDLGLRLLDALHHAHEHGVVHRDVKPGNILTDASGRVLLGDFGLARDLSADPAGATQSGFVAGTLAYMSPEQARQLKDAVDGRTDLYSAAAVLYELLTGEPPYGGTPSLAVLAGEDSPEVRPVRTLAPNVPRDLALCVERGLRRDSDMRYANAEDFASDLLSWLTGKPVVAKPLSAAERLRGRLRSRRFVLRSAALAVGTTVAGSSAAVWLGARARKRREWADLRIDGSQLPAATTLEVVRLGLDPEQILDRSEPHKLGGKDFEHSLPPGPIRLRFQTPGAAAFELERVLAARSTVDVRPQVPSPPPGGTEWVDVPAGEQALTLPLEGRDPIAFTPTVRGFRIGTGPVTNGQFTAYLQESGRSCSYFGTAERDLIRSTRVGDDWDLLPATGLTYTEVRDAAEWWGCRLPTWAEWMRFMAFNRAASPAGEDSPTLELRGESAIIDEDGNRSSSKAYALYVEPAQPILPGTPLLLAAVTEWTSSPMLRPIGSDLAIDHRRRIACGVPWHRRDAKPLWKWLEYPRVVPESDTPSDVGFRLVPA